MTRRYVKDASNGTLSGIDLGPAIGQGVFGYDAPGRRVSTAWPIGASRTDRYLTNGVHASERYNAGIKSYFSTSYRADTAGRIRADSRTLSGSSAGDTTNRIFGYDALGRFTGIQDVSDYSWTCADHGGRSNPDPDYGSYDCPIDNLPTPAVYSYDDAGNQNGPGDTVGVGDQMRTAVFVYFPATYTYDADGNVLTGAISDLGFGYNWAYHWSSDNRLLGGSLSVAGQSHVESLDYDALGQPVVTRDGSDGHIVRVTLYDDGNVLADLDSVGNRETEYIYDAGTDRPYALVTGDSTVTGAQYFILDDFGNVQGTVRDSVTVAQTVAYSDWGVPGVSGDTTNRLMWKGLPYDPVLNLIQMRARWYDPVTGRFVSEDPIGLAGGINPYVFANNDPINGSDPSGMYSDTDCKISKDHACKIQTITITAPPGSGNGGGIEILISDGGGDSDSSTSLFFPTFNYKPTTGAKPNTSSIGPTQTTTAKKSLTACLVASTGAGLAVGTDFVFYAGARTAAVAGELSVAGAKAVAGGLARSYGFSYFGMSGASGLAAAKSVSASGITTTSMFINSSVTSEGFSWSGLAKSLVPFVNSKHAVGSAYHACNQAE